MGDEGKTVNLMNYIQDSLRAMDLTKPLLSTLAQKGEDEVKQPRFTSPLLCLNRMIISKSYFILNKN